MRRYVAEAIGVYFLVLMGTGAVLADGFSDGAVGLVGVSMTFGLIVATMIYTLGDLSGAHINPAVTIALAVARRFPARHVVPYVLAQCLGALGASATLRALYPAAKSLGATLPIIAIGPSFLTEFVLTFLLVFVIFGVTSQATSVLPFAGFVIGATVSIEVFVGGPLTGASMNPARSLGPAVVGGQTEHLWLYWVAPIAGGVAAALVTGYLRPPQPDSED